MAQLLILWHSRTQRELVQVGLLQYFNHIFSEEEEFNWSGWTDLLKNSKHQNLRDGELNPDLARDKRSF